jgi:hypothetical protein
MKQVTRSDLKEVSIPEFMKDQIEKIETIIRETSYGTQECPTRNKSSPCSCDLSVILKKRQAEGCLARPLATSDATNIYQIAQAKPMNAEIRAHFSV